MYSYVTETSSVKKEKEEKKNRRKGNMKKYERSKEKQELYSTV